MADVIEKGGYIIESWYEGMTAYHAEKDGVEVYHGYSLDELIKRIGFNPCTR